MLASASCHYFSPDNSYIVYAEIDDTDVSVMSWPWYGPRSDAYGEPVMITYPKVSKPVPVDLLRGHFS